MSVLCCQELNVKHVSCDIYGSCEIMKLRSNVTIVYALIRSLFIYPLFEFHSFYV